MLKRMKFELWASVLSTTAPLNVVEQINQTWAYFVVVSAARQLLTLHLDVGGFHLAPGAHASLELDIMSDASGIVGIETFAAVNPKNNKKLFRDL